MFVSRLLSALLILCVSTAYAAGVRSGGSTAVVKHPYRFCWLSDIHYDPSDHDQLTAFLDSMATAGCAFGVVTGDNGEDVFQFAPEFAEYGDSLSAIIARAAFPVYFALGNHEAVPADTASGRDPYYTARQRFPIPGANGGNYGYYDINGLRLIFLQNNANVSINPSNPESYRVNNPFYGGWEPGTDWDGIDDPASTQRQMVSEAMATLNGRTPIFLQHRPVYGSDANNGARWSYITAGTDSGYIAMAEDALGVGKRGISLGGDQHISMFTQALIDSGVATLTQAGFYHNVVSSGAISGLPHRAIDTTDCFIAGTPWLKAYIAHPEGDVTVSLARTSVGIEDTLTIEGDPDLRSRFFGVLYTVYGDVMVQEVFRVVRDSSDVADWYPGHLALMLAHRNTVYLDVRGR